MWFGIDISIIGKIGTSLLEFISWPILNFLPSEYIVNHFIYRLKDNYYMFNPNNATILSLKINNSLFSLLLFSLLRLLC